MSDAAELDAGANRSGTAEVQARGAAARRRSVALQVVGTALALALLARVVDPAALMDRLRATDWRLFGLALVLIALQIPLVAVRWRLIVRAMSEEGAVVPGPARFQQITWIAQFFGQVLPFIAGDGMRVLLLRQNGTSLRVAFKSTLLDRGIAALALVAMAFPAALLSDTLAAAGALLRPGILVLGAGLLGAIVMLACVDVIHRFGARWRVLGAVTETLRDMRAILVSPSDAPRVVGLCFAVHGISIVAFWLLARGQGVPLHLADSLAIVPLVLLVSMVPIAVGGWGLRELFVVSLLGSTGGGTDGALLLSLSFGTVVLLAALPGVLVLALSGRARRLPAAEAERPAC